MAQPTSAVSAAPPTIPRQRRIPVALFPSTAPALVAPDQKPFDTNALLRAQKHSNSGVFSEYMKATFDKQEGDFIIRVGGREIKTSKYILKGHDNVFGRAISNGMKETSTGLMDITDEKYETVYTTLRYLHSGYIEFTTIEELCDLYNLADKYAISDLRVILRFKIDSLARIREICIPLLKSAQKYLSMEGIVKEVVGIICSMIDKNVMGRNAAHIGENPAILPLAIPHIEMISELSDEIKTQILMSMARCVQ